MSDQGLLSDCLPECRFVSLRQAHDEWVASNGVGDGPLPDNLVPVQDEIGFLDHAESCPHLERVRAFGREHFGVETCEHDWDVVDMLGAGGWQATRVCHTCGGMELL